MTKCENDLRESGPFDNCLRCEFLGNGCSGPRTTAMTGERYLVWMLDLRKLRGVSNQTISESTGLSKATVDDFFAGRRKDIGRITAGLLESFLIGGHAKWPCAMELSADNKEIVYQDRPETLEALRVAKEENTKLVDTLEQLRSNIGRTHDFQEKELATVRAEAQEKAEAREALYRADVQEYKDLVAHLQAQIERKDDYIDRLAKKAGI